ncbi:MAG: amidophosphoribosyltransferase [Alphaproteobacteria bacterium]|nr:MAG: amidophosphoribosyltransferase [Alphaproteobacteria bacterium]
MSVIIDSPPALKPLTTHPFAGDDKLREECGVFGIFGSPDAAAHTVLGLHALQHRGQEAAGVTTHDGREFHTERFMGLVSEHFTSPQVLEKLPGHAAIGHVRYSTTGETVMRNVQPLFADLATTGFAIAHNGNITNAWTLRKQLVAHGAIFQSTSDTEVILHLVATSTFRTLLDKLIDALRKIEGAWSLVALSKFGLIGVRDPLGVRPLVLGRMGDAHILCSETCALDIIGAEYVRDIEPGEIITISERGVKSLKPFPPGRARPCIFEHVYFSRPDSFVDGMSVYEVRKRIGAELAREAPVEADMVVPVPDSGVPAAIGYAQESGLPFELGIIRNHYVGRTFIEPSDQIRHLGVKLKHNANRWLIEGRRIVLVDDSIVRGTTSLKIVDMLRQAGAKEVHMRIASPPTRHSCFYGVDTPERDKLLAARMDVEKMREFIHADTLAFLTIDGLYRACRQPEGRNDIQPQFCDACFTGDYPTHLTDLEEREAVADQLTLLASTGG